MLANLLAQLLALFRAHAPAAIVRTGVLALLLLLRLLLWLWLPFHPPATTAKASGAATTTATKTAATTTAMKRPGHGGARADEHRQACRCKYGNR